MLGWERTIAWCPALFLVVTAAAAGGCSFSFSVGDTPESVAQELIEDELGEQLGIGEITATCEVAPNRDPGTTFTCTSPSEIGQIEWLATLEDEDTVSVSPSNLLGSDDLVALEEAAVDVLEARVGIPLGTENFDCGDGPIVLGPDSIVNCALTDPTNGDVYDAELEITNFETGDFNVVVADLPR